MKTGLGVCWLLPGPARQSRKAFRLRCFSTGQLVRWILSCVAALLVCYSLSASAATRYVWQDSPNPTQPFSNWDTAAHTIQEAADAAVAGDTVWVTNGVYATGGRAFEVNLTNRVAITKPIMLASVNGPASTVIVGARDSGDGPIRCVYLGTNATLTGFTLTNGQTYRSGDVRGISGAGVYCRPSAVVSNCIITGNHGAFNGGGVREGTLYHCILAGNTAVDGAGAHSSSLNFCTLTGNRAEGGGGGAHGGSLVHCTVTGNASRAGGGVRESTIGSSIIYFNTADIGPNYDRSTLRNTCAWPLPVAGDGNIAADPLLATATHLSIASPCRARVAPPLNAVDIDGEQLPQMADLGADELNPGRATSLLAVAIQTPYPTVATGFRLPLTAQIEGQTIGSRWDFGDGTIVSNQPFARHAWTTPGTYAVTLIAFNDAHPQGLSASVNVQVVAQPVYHVNSFNVTPVFPYADWRTASRSIEEAIAADTLPGRLVLVTNGIFGVGFTEFSSIQLTNGVVMRSVNGPRDTLIRAPDRTAPGVRVGSECLLSGFTLSNGVSGAWCDTTGMITNCVITGNSGFSFGGGARGGTLTHCLIQNNRSYHGGGAYGCRAYNCVFTGNTSDYGSAAEECILDHCTIVGNEVAYTYDGAVISSLVHNSIIHSNTARGGAVANHRNDTNSSPLEGSAFYHTSTTPLPLRGSGNFTNAPSFMDTARSDFHLRFGSPGIDAAGAGLEPLTSDFEDRRRPLDGDGDAVAVADVGAYEFDLLSVVSTNWLLRYGLDPNDPQVFASDPDRDNHTTLDEWVADTNPTNALSVLRITAISKGPPVTVQFTSSSNRLYTLRHAPLLTNAIWTDARGQTDVPGSGGLQVLRHTNVVPPRFYRVSVRVP